MPLGADRRSPHSTDSSGRPLPEVPRPLVARRAADRLEEQRHGAGNPDTAEPPTGRLGAVTVDLSLDGAPAAPKALRTASSSRSTFGRVNAPSTRGSSPVWSLHVERVVRRGRTRSLQRARRDDGSGIVPRYAALRVWGVGVRVERPGEPGLAEQGIVLRYPARPQSLAVPRGPDHRVPRARSGPDDPPLRQPIELVPAAEDPSGRPSAPQAGAVSGLRVRHPRTGLDDRNPRVRDPGVSTGAGDENRTRTLSLGSCGSLRPGRSLSWANGLDDVPLCLAVFTVIPRCSPPDLVRLWCGG